MNAAVLLLLLFQNADYTQPVKSSADAAMRETQLRQVATALAGPATPSAAEEAATAHATAHDAAFVGKFNALINKLMDFADSYKSKQAIDVRKAKDVRKAWLELETAEALFRADPKK
jgi:uncharacterized protein (DUF58 family)